MTEDQVLEAIIQDGVSGIVEKIGKLEYDLAAANKAKDQLQKDIIALKQGRGWDTVELVHDKTTGMSAVVRTEYRVQAHNMRLDFTDEMRRGMY